MDLKKRTFEDLIGNLADDAKKALGEGLERESTPKNWTPAGPPGVTPPVGTSSGAVVLLPPRLVAWPLLSVTSTRRSAAWRPCPSRSPDCPHSWKSFCRSSSR
jgi:hypothetical protein